MKQINQSTTAARNTAQILRAICDIGNKQIASQINKDQSVISRFKNDEARLTLSEFSELLIAINIELSHRNERSLIVDKLEYTALMHLANFILNNLPHTSESIEIPAHLYNSMIYLSSQRLNDMRSAMAA